MQYVFVCRSYIVTGGRNIRLSDEKTRDSVKFVSGNQLKILMKIILVTWLLTMKLNLPAGRERVKTNIMGVTKICY